MNPLDGSRRRGRPNDPVLLAQRARRNVLVGRAQ
jgi:hypothetical protein